jgi:hypothetical protein
MKRAKSIWGGILGTITLIAVRGSGGYERYHQFSFGWGLRGQMNREAWNTYPWSGHFRYEWVTTGLLVPE